ncbi:acyl carrier protein [Streptomyces sp. NPDC059853]|uniref:acyl carrier protein n=1 Tax=Streptomyces sp. NPDC059853 TaxID=3346973 RepID=UPI003661365D
MPESGLREAVRSVWEDAFGITIGGDPDFFEIGGDSVTALSISAGLEKKFKVRPEIWILFDNPQLSQYVQVYSEILVEDGR